ncbi:MAG: glycosyltransferase family 4 protein, partial [Verrucomicrobiaceae bacterium]|nr:glycosyltransferase family 4 protein [Verrucomicrobiaceae bacterium]
LPYFSNLARFRPGNAVDEARAGVRFLFVGGLTMRKGADLLLQAFTAIQPDTAHTLTVTGNGPLRQRLHDAAPGACRFTGFADWSALPAAYADHDCLVVPSRYDGWGMVVPEGLAAGLPVISTDQMGSALDLITPDVNGWRVPAASFESLRAAMERAADQIPRDRAGWRQRALNAVSGHQLEDGVCHFERAIQSALGGATR